MKRFFITSLLIFFTLCGYAKEETAIFAGGCFWCVEADFDKVPGVISTISGFDGGYYKNPTYKIVSSGTTKYVESVKITYDSDKVSYATLVNYFFRHIDPTSKNGQFCDRGPQYRSVIFYLDTEQQKIAQKSLQEIEKIFPKVYTEVIPSTHFYPAEEGHQNYYQKNPLRYKYYRYHCGRDKQINKVWQSAK